MEAGSLKRTHARLCIALLILTLAFIALPLMMSWAFGAELAVWGRAGFIGAVGAMAAVTAVRYSCLRCSGCGRGMAPPQWKAGRRRYCPYCGEPFIYDDEV